MTNCLFVGGPADGTIQDLPDPRPFVKIAELPEAPPVSPEVNTAYYERVDYVYSRHFFRVENTEVVIYSPSKWSTRDVLSALCNVYTESRGKK